MHYKIQKENALKKRDRFESEDTNSSVCEALSVILVSRTQLVHLWKTKIRASS